MTTAAPLLDDRPDLICHREPVTFYLGTHRARWLYEAPLEVPLFLSHRVLGRRKSPFPAADLRRIYAVDSGAFTELSRHGRFQTSPQAYLEALLRYDAEIGDMAFAAPQDWMCEPFMIAKTGLDVAEHQRRTVENFVLLESLWYSQGGRGECPVMPVLQGWTVDDYLRCYELYEEAGVRLAVDYPTVGVGSVCRRQRTGEIGEVFRELASLDLPLHGFGVKLAGLARYGQCVSSADSLAWSYAARHSPTLPGCTGHQTCSTCLAYALDYRARLLETLSGARVPYSVLRGEGELALAA